MLLAALLCVIARADAPFEAPSPGPPITWPPARAGHSGTASGVQPVIAVEPHEVESATDQQPMNTPMFIR